MTIRRTLVETPSGFIHVRTAGSGSPILLLHWTPASGRQYVPVLEELGKAGYAGYAPDHMGYGHSDPRPAPWMVEDYADNIAAVMDGLGLKTAAVVGGHVSSEFAAELALRHPERVTQLVLDGCPVWDRAFRDEVLKVSRQPTPSWTEDGAHIAWVWERSLWLQRMWDSKFELDDEGAALLRDAVIDSMLAQQMDDAAEALRNYDMEAALRKIHTPTLALTAETDPLNNCHEMVLGLVDGSVGHTFSGSHPLHDPEKAGEYADVILSFIAADSRDSKEP